MKLTMIELSSSAEWFWKNRDWFFQGLGAMAIMGGVGGVGRLIWKKLQPTTENEKPSTAVAVKATHGAPALAQHMGNGSVSISQIQQPESLSISDVRDIALLVFQANVTKLWAEASAEARKSVDELLSHPAQKLTKELKPERCGRSKTQKPPLRQSSAARTKARLKTPPPHTSISGP